MIYVISRVLTLSSSSCSGSLSRLFPAESPSYSSRARVNGAPDNEAFLYANLLSTSRLLHSILRLIHSAGTPESRRYVRIRQDKQDFIGLSCCME
jgi:hypothetical protein